MSKKSGGPPTTWHELRNNYAEDEDKKFPPYTIKQIKDALLLWVITHGDDLVPYDTNAVMPEVQEILYGDFSAPFRYAPLEEVNDFGVPADAAYDEPYGDITHYLRLSNTGKFFLIKMEKADAKQSKRKTRT